MTTEKPTPTNPLSDTEKSPIENSCEANNETGAESGIEVDVITTLFSPGQIVATPGAVDTMRTNNCLSFDLLIRHLTGDWGVVPKEDAEANQHALENGLRILSSYPMDNGARIWLITEADRSVTTFLLPEEY